VGQDGDDAPRRAPSLLPSHHLTHCAPPSTVHRIWALPRRVLHAQQALGGARQSPLRAVNTPRCRAHQHAFLSLSLRAPHFRLRLIPPPPRGCFTRCAASRPAARGIALRWRWAASSGPFSACRWADAFRRWAPQAYLYARHVAHRFACAMTYRTMADDLYVVRPFHKANRPAPSHCNLTPHCLYLCLHHLQQPPSRYFCSTLHFLVPAWRSPHCLAFCLPMQPLYLFPVAERFAALMAHATPPPFLYRAAAWRAVPSSIARHTATRASARALHSLRRTAVRTPATHFHLHFSSTAPGGRTFTGTLSRCAAFRHHTLFPGRPSGYPLFTGELTRARSIITGRRRWELRLRRTAYRTPCLSGRTHL